MREREGVERGIMRQREIMRESEWGKEDGVERRRDPEHRQSGRVFVSVRA